MKGYFINNQTVIASSRCTSNTEGIFCYPLDFEQPLSRLMLRFNALLSLIFASVVVCTEVNTVMNHPGSGGVLQMREYDMSEQVLRIIHHILSIASPGGEAIPFAPLRSHWQHFSVPKSFSDKDDVKSKYYWSPPRILIPVRGKLINA